MVFFLMILLLIIFHSAKIAPAGEFAKDYLSKEKTNAVKGIFVILIIFSHYSQYVNLTGIYDEPYLILKKHLNQMVVAMFWFYSGYGMMESAAKKKFDYIKTIMTKRFWMVLLNFDLAVLLFWITGMILGRKYSLYNVLWSFVGWSSIGNSNWYIFVTLVLYVLMFFAFYLLKWYDKKWALYAGGVLMTVMTVAFIYCMMKIGRPTRYYNTTILFVLGIWYSLFKTKIEGFIMKNDYIYTLSALVLTSVYMITFCFRWEYGLEGYTVWAVAFTLLIVMVSMKITFCNEILLWFGNHVFSVYILQRIPMMLLASTGIAKSHKYMFLILSMMLTVFMAMVFDYITDKMWAKILRKKK